MNINELKSDIQKHKSIVLPSQCAKALDITLPFYTLHYMLRNGVRNVEEQNYGLSKGETDILITIMSLGNNGEIISPKKLTEKLMFTSGAITKLLKKLEDKKYITRLNNEFDKRSKLVQITTTGKDICERVFKDILSYENECFNALNKEEKKVFQKLLLKTIAQM